MISRDHLLQPQKWSKPTIKKSSKGGRRPVWMSKKLLSKHKHKKEAFRSWKWSQVIQEQHRVTVLVCRAREGLGKSKQRM